MKQHQYSSINWLKILLTLIIVIGIFIRFINLDTKVYWTDEVATSLRIAGYTNKEAVEQIFNGSLITVAELQKYQYPNAEKTFLDTIKSLASSDVHPPLYFLTLRAWVQSFGDSITVTRSWSVVVSLLILPLLYWICVELFNSSLTGWIALGLYSISPIQFSFAQQARYYTFWAVFILASGLALLRAIRTERKWDWIIYSFTLILGLYTQIFHGLIILQNGIFMIINEKFSLNKSLIYYLLSVVFSMIFFLPWAIAMLIHKDEFVSQSSWIANRVNLQEWLSIFIYNVVSTFVNFWYSARYSPNILLSNLPWARFLIPSIILLIIYSFYILIRYAPRQSSTFLLSLIAVNVLFLSIPDFLSGGIRGLIERYLIPAYFGVEIAVAYTLANHISIFPAKIWQKKLWQVILVILLTAGLISCLAVSPAPGYFTYWPSKYPTSISISQEINRADKPLVLSYVNLTNAFTLGHLLTPKVTLQLNGDGKLDKVLDTKRFNSFFLYETVPGKADEFKKINENLPALEMNLLIDRNQQRLWKIDITPPMQKEFNKMGS
ncbi:MAG: hypothetical protein N5P05_003678 [Chroococcopsis gigantea SAG 12.99]|jgi:uncharacterized membrane protein|nr:glycosyltransferase family 39 protein [Chlorogloea purpurea SAG 13.99]MDV3002072.1 hypothetical protein [Chroococcopsis gigantea SAG 12.99]